MKFLSGFKTVIGFIATAVSVIVPAVKPEMVSGIGDHIVGIVQGASALLLALGIIHKKEKAAK
jgi:hypothetical protein